MRATQDYALHHGFVGGFPNFHHTEYGPPTYPSLTTVCGTILIKPSEAVWRDISMGELGNPPLDDIGARFRATNDFAAANGFLGGFPNFYHAEQGGDIVCGSILLHQSAGEWRDVLLWQDPRQGSVANNGLVG
jgi:hypothetical protein